MLAFHKMSNERLEPLLLHCTGTYKGYAAILVHLALRLPLTTAKSDLGKLSSFNSTLSAELKIREDSCKLYIIFTQ